MASNPRIVAAPGAQQSNGGISSVPTWVWYAGGAIVGVVLLLLVLNRTGNTGSPIAATGAGGGVSLNDLLGLMSQAQQNGGGAVSTNPPGGGRDSIPPPYVSQSSGFNAARDNSAPPSVSSTTTPSVQKSVNRIQGGGSPLNPSGNPVHGPRD